MLNVKLSLLYFPLSIVISMSKYDSVVGHSVAEALENVCHQLRYQMQGCSMLANHQYTSLCY